MSIKSCRIYTKQVYGEALSGYIESKSSYF